MIPPAETARYRESVEWFTEDKNDSVYFVSVDLTGA